METVIVLGVNCNDYAAHVQNTLEKITGIVKIEIRIPEKIALVTFDSNKVSKEELAAKVKDAGNELNSLKKLNHDIISYS